MIIKIEEQELESELQELYLTAKQWLSDIGFIESEQLFLARLIDDMPNAVRNDFRWQVEEVNIANEKLRSAILMFMNKLELLITKKESKWDRSLIDDFAGLQQSIGHSLAKLKLLKYRLVKIRLAA